MRTRLLPFALMLSLAVVTSGSSIAEEDDAVSPCCRL